ncbi:hypothetical protein BDW59DRAFT_166762 [Aspergillus cavernicola]|uniref:Uncharacterized protein n=1 Tax=Aspergillus cavernicola TaxID=176166 RepID=A0ABR4HJG5_9EURO
MARLGRFWVLSLARVSSPSGDATSWRLLRALATDLASQSGWVSAEHANAGYLIAGEYETEVLLHQVTLEGATSLSEIGPGVINELTWAGNMPVRVAILDPPTLIW